MLELAQAGLNWNEAAGLGIEQVLCIVHHHRLNCGLGQLEAEAARIASVPFADTGRQQRLLSAVEHRRAALLDRFYRRREEGRTCD